MNNNKTDLTMTKTIITFFKSTTILLGKNRVNFKVRNRVFRMFLKPFIQFTWNTLLLVASTWSDSLLCCFKARVWWYFYLLFILYLETSMRITNGLKAINIFSQNIFLWGMIWIRRDGPFYSGKIHEEEKALFCILRSDDETLRPVYTFSIRIIVCKK